MASYVVIRRAEIVEGDRAILAVVVDDGKHMRVLGDSPISVDLDDRVADAAGAAADERLRSILTGYSHYQLDGPIPIDGSTATVLPVLTHLYGL